MDYDKLLAYLRDPNPGAVTPHTPQDRYNAPASITFGWRWWWFNRARETLSIGALTRYLRKHQDHRISPHARSGDDEPGAGYNDDGTPAELPSGAFLENSTDRDNACLELRAWTRDDDRHVRSRNDGEWPTECSGRRIPRSPLLGVTYGIPEPTCVPISQHPIEFWQAEVIAQIDAGHRLSVVKSR